MGGINIAGRAVVGAQTGSLPYIVLENSADWFYNVWRVIESVPTRLTAFENATGGPELYYARLSPDTLWVATSGMWQNASPFGAVLYVVSSLGGTPVEVWNDGGDQDHLLSPAWHPDSDHITFIYGPGIPTSDFGRSGSVCVAQRSNPGVTPTVLWTPQIQTPQREGAFNSNYSSDGSMISFFVNCAGGGGGDATRQGLWVMDADGSNDTHIDAWETVLTDGGYMQFGSQSAWSNDSEWIAYIDAPLGTTSLYKIRPDGSDKTLLKEGAGDGYSCRVGYNAWSEDDSYLTFSATNSGDNNWRIFRVDADGTGETELVNATDGPWGGFWQHVYLNTALNRMEWINAVNVGEVSSAELDGTDIQIIADLSDGGIGDQFYSGTGHEWV